MKTSENGIKLIEFFEGLRLSVYNDVVGIPTIGYGHKILPSEDFSNGITQAIAEAILTSDLAKVEYFINSCNLSINQNQFDALADFAFNLGVGSLHQLLSHGLDQLPTQIVQWDHAGHVEVAGLLKRRKAELTFWQTPDGQNPPSPSSL